LRDRISSLWGHLTAQPTRGYRDERKLREEKMNGENVRFNPEPWVRSCLWVALAAAVLFAVFRGSPVKLSGGGVDVEMGGQAVTGANVPEPQAGEPAIQRDTSGTTFVSICPPRTRAVGGSCWIKEHNTGTLRSFGAEFNKEGSWQFVCLWGDKVDGNARAICLPST
jgi:hypothetical protein